MRWLCDVLDKRNILYDWYVLGTAFKQEELNEIKEWFCNNKNIHFLGYKDNVYPYIKQMDYLALLTDREANCLVISEALILGIPCITTNFEGVEKQIIDKNNGIVLQMINDDNSYENRLNDIILLKENLKNNVRQVNYNRDNIINWWINLLSK